MSEATVIAPRLLHVVRELATCLAPTDIAWARTGSVGLLLQGAPVTPNDVDVQTDQIGAYAIERVFAAYSV